MNRFLTLLITVVCATAAPTQIRDTGYTGISGVLFSGRMTISAPDMTTADGHTVLRWEQSYMISDGLIAVDLEPNDTATPAGTSYYVVYRPKSGQAWSERWVVPASPTPLRVSQVHTASTPVPTVMIQPQQIDGSGAAPGQALLWNGSRYAPGNVATSTKWGGIIGTLADQTDLGNALGAKAGLSHLHLVGDVTGLQAALDEKTVGAGTAGTVPVWSSAQGLSDSTITSNNGTSPATTITMSRNPLTGQTPARMTFANPWPTYSVLTVGPDQGLPASAAMLVVQFLDGSGNPNSVIYGPDAAGKYTLQGFNIQLPPLMNKQQCNTGGGYSSLTFLINHTLTECAGTSSPYYQFGTFQYLYFIAQTGTAQVTITVNWTERQPYGTVDTPRSQVLGTLDASTTNQPLFGQIFMLRKTGTPVTITGSSSPSGTTGMWGGYSYFAY